MPSRRAATGQGPSGSAATSRRQPSAVPGGRHLGNGKARGGHPVLAAVAVLLSLTLVSGLVFAGVQLLRLQSNFDTKPLNIGQDQAQFPADTNTDSMQILVLGTDNRDGQDSNNSDVMMLVNMAADRSHVTVVSFPRDLLVPLPACTDPESGLQFQAMDLAQLNGALGNGGPGCTVAAINEMTGLSIDHFMMADFNAVKELSNTLGGVEVCVNQPVDDPLSGLNIPAGVSSVQGDQALAFLRTRHGFGDGGDEGRIKAQQSFLASMVRKVQGEGTLNNLPRLYSIADTVTKNLTVDEGLTDISTLIALAGRMKDVDLGNVAFVTAPVVPYELDPNRLVLDEDAARPLFDALVADQPVGAEAEEEPAAETPGTATPGTASPAPAEPEVDPSAVPVTILDGISGSESGRDAELAEYLLSEGFTQALAGGLSASTTPGTQVFFAPGFDAMALKVAEALNIPASQIAVSSAVSGVVVQVGSDFAEGDVMEDTGSLGGLSGQTAAQVTCQSAFGY
ncbi:LCP family protein [Arthrobacter gandavensis]|uniref:LCP family protein n=1 Tax=Arthrobacter gandavensis TaxID=169960 RepID=UPI00188E4713|nr:LCP family protein [Arthrobacter gandavensis]MBF4995231.1 LCP family protein [Arthrobacter gandavensis]